MNIKDYGYKEELVNISNNENELVARIITTYRDRYEIVCNKGKSFAKLKVANYYNNKNAIYPVIGDFVLIEWNATGDCLILETLKRNSMFSRLDPSPDGKHKQIIATNFDYVFIMQSLNNNFNLRRLERYLTLTYESGAVPIIVLTKCDLVEDYNTYISQVESIAIGVDIYAVSAKAGEGLDKLNKYLIKGNTIVLLGSSGVGKSTLINKLADEEVMKTSEIRENDDRGRHTTTNRKLIMLKNGSMIIDTPGMRELGMIDISDSIDKTFQDVERFLGKCKFSNCTHTNEPGCAIIEAMQNGELSQDRFNSYIKLKKESMYTQNSEDYLKEKRERFKEYSKINRYNKKK